MVVAILSTLRLINTGIEEPNMIAVKLLNRYASLHMPAFALYRLMLKINRSDMYTSMVMSFAKLYSECFIAI